MAKKKSGGKKPLSKNAADAGDLFPLDFSPNGAFEVLRMLSEKTGMDPLQVMSIVLGGQMSKGQMPGGDGDTFRIPATRSRKLKAGSVEDLLQQASEADDPRKSLPLLQKAIEKGEKELKRELQHNVGEFGDIPKAQAYLMARNELTGCLLELERFDDAIQNMTELLHLDESDVLGVRWLLLEWYCRLNQIENARTLIQQFPDDNSALFSVTSLCLDFQKTGRTEQLDAELRAALEENPYLAEELLGGDPVDSGHIDSFTIGSPEEAILYARQFRSLWKSTPGAMAWLKEVSQDVSDDDDLSESHVVGYAADAIADAKELKKGKEVWFLDIDVLDSDGNSTAEPVEWNDESPSKDWIMSVINAENQDLIRIEPGEFSLTPAGAVLELCTTMLEPQTGKPRRPKTIQCVKGLLCPEIRETLKQLKIGLEEVDETPELIQFMRRQRLNDAPGEFPLDQILELPMTGEVIWEIDWRAIDAWIHDPETGEATQPWITLVCSPEEGLVRAQHVTPSRPTKEVVAATLAKAILEPLQGEPERPYGLIVGQLSHRIDLEETADSIECGVIVEATRMTDKVMESMEDHRKECTEHQFEPLMRAEHMTPPVLEDLFKASAEYFKSRIYTRVRAESVIEITCPEFCKTPVFAVVMGQNGQEIGIMIFFNLKSAQGMFRSRSNDYESLAKKMSGLGYSIGPKEQLHPLDVAAADQFGWPVPATDAWPSIYHIEQGEIRSLTTAQVRLTTVSILATMKAHQQSPTSATHDIALCDRVVSVNTRKINL